MLGLRDLYIFWVVNILFLLLFLFLIGKELKLC